LNIERKKARIEAAIQATLQADPRHATPAVATTLEPIAIIGLSGTFPQSVSAQAFWQALDDDRGLIEEIPLSRFDYTWHYSGPEVEEGRMRTRWGGFIPAIDQFDAGFFGLPPEQAVLMDPQQRLLLMSVRQTFEDAGYAHTDWQGSRTGVFIAAERNEYHLNLLQAGVDTGDGLDQSDSMLANRISHFYDLRGPSERIDAMCAGGAVAIHHAVRALCCGEIDAAVVGACNLLLRPDVFIKLSQSRQMSPQATVSSFGADADGFLRAEGVCSLLLKPLSRARADGDSIYALIRNSAINYNGRGGASIAAPSVSAHSQLVQACYRGAAVDPRQLDYIEAQGMGNPVADIAEWDALNHALLQLGSEQGVELAQGQCLVSTLKPMTGHMHAASALGAIFKIIRSLQTDRIHKVLDFRQANEHLQTAGQPCRIAEQTVAWPPRQTPRLAGLHAYGAGGNNAHILIEEYPRPVPVAPGTASDVLIFALSAPTPALLATLCGQLWQHLSDTPQLVLEQVSDTLKFGRVKYATGLVILACDREELLAALSGLRVALPLGEVVRSASVGETSASLQHEWARRWLAGEQPEGTGARLPRVHLPTTPFDTTSYWFDAALAQAPSRPGAVSAPWREALLRTAQEAEQAVRTALSVALRQPAEALDLSAQFSELGFDSMMVRLLCRHLREQGVVVEPAVLFEQPTPARLVAWLIGAGRPVAATRAVRGNSAGLAERQDIAIIGLAGRYPKSQDLQAFWDCLAAGVDCIETIPAERWSLGEHFDADPQQAVASGKSFGKWGGFIEGLNEFDPMFFNLSLAEATYMHPKERQFMQCVWHAMEDAGYTPDQLAQEKVGVYVGVSKAGHDNYKDSFFSIANRVSYRFGFSGPSLPIDTACSSSLTAVHEACLHLQAGECSVAVVGGVNAYTHPSTFAEFARLGVLSADGKSRAFGIGANGFVPGEGVGALLLKPLARAQADGDVIHGVIAGSAVNHGGKANGYTVPSPEAHRSLIRLALERARISADDVSYVEAHGTGTALGDPIEFRGLVEAFRQDTARLAFCRLGSVKTNIGHLEAAAGIAGLTKILLQLRHGQIAPSLHAQTLNPDIDQATSPFCVPQQLEPWERGNGERIACLSSFGAGGSNAHVVVRQAPASSEPPRQEKAAGLFLLSARNEASLRRQAGAIRQYLEVYPQLSLADICYTLQVGRESMEWRLSYVAGSTAELIAALVRYGEGASTQGLQVAAVKSSERIALFGDDASALALLDTWYAQGRLEPLAQLWRAGEAIDWKRLVPRGSARRISLPGYCFDKEFIEPAPMLMPARGRLEVGVLAVEPAAQPSGIGTLLVRPRWQVLPDRPRSLVDDLPGSVLACEWQGVLVDEGWLRVRSASESPAERYRYCVERVSEHLCELIVEPRTGVTRLQVVVSAGTTPWLGGLHGLLRSAQWESSKVLTQLIELDPGFTREQVRQAMAQAATLHQHPWLRFDAQGCQAREWTEVALLSEHSPCAWKEAGVYLLTGGLGGLAQLFARDILTRVGRATLVLVGRSAPDAAAQARLQALRQLGGEVIYERLDITDAPATERLVAQIEARHGGLSAVLHCAGELRDTFLRHLQPQQRDVVLASKVAGTLALDQATRHCRLDGFVLFSSAAAAVGHPGQATYAAANGFMDGFAEQREAQVRAGERHGRTLSIGWGLWQDGGMQLDAQARALLERESGMQALSREHGLAAFHQLMAGQGNQAVVIDGDVQRLRLRLHPQGAPAPLEPAASDLRQEIRTLAGLALGIAPAELEDDQDFDGYGLDPVRFNQLIEALNTAHGLELSPLAYRQIRTLDELLAHVREQGAGRPLRQAPVTLGEGDSLLAHGLERLKDILSRAVGWPVARLNSDEPFERYGLDSMMVMKMTAELEELFGPLPKTLFFEYASLRELGGYLARAHAATLHRLAGQASAAQPQPLRESVEAAVAEPVPSASPLPPPAAPADEPFEVAVIGLAGRYPQARNLEEFWQVLCEGRDCISEIPPQRWDHALYYSADEDAPGKTYARWGGFIDGVDEFDPGFFNISPREAAIMEPQERLFLQVAHEAIEDSGYTRQSLAANATCDGIEGAVGVFVGVTYEEYQLYAAEATAQGRPMVLSMSPSSIANRVSFCNNFHGPSLALDSMCASSLTTVHLACQSLRSGECQVALAGGVNVSIHPAKFLMLGAGKFASRKGRCESFAEGASGYVPSEGVGAVLLKPLARALADGDRIYGVIRGSAINHGGRTNGYAVPNPNAQAAVIARALHAAKVNPRQIGYVEAHGTGTALGDPIEVAGLTSAWQALTSDRQFCALGSVKSNIGHCESAAGIAGLTKVLLQMQHGLLVSSLHADKLNPNIDFAATPFRVQRTLAPWERPLGEEGRPGPRLAAISSFGAGGANAHLIVSEAPAPRAATAPAQRSGPWPIVLSARSRDALLRAAEALRDWLGRGSHREVSLEALAYTLQVGREAWEWRLALLVENVEQLATRLGAFIKGDEPAPGCWSGQLPEELSLFARPDADSRARIGRLLAEQDLGAVLQAWVEGCAVDWSLLHRDWQVQRLALPTYPFARQRYWLPVAQDAQPAVPAGKIRLRPLGALGDVAMPGVAPAVQVAVAEPVPVPVQIPVMAAPPVAEPKPPLAVPAPVVPDDVQRFLRQSLAAMLYCEPEQIREGSRFLDLGLDSVIAAQWIREINKHFALKVPADGIYSYPAFNLFAQFVEGERSRGSVAAPVLPERAPASPAAAIRVAVPSRESTQPDIEPFLKHSLGELLFLEPDQVRSGARFLDLGMDSVTGAQWIRTLNRHFGIQLAADSIYATPTLRSLADEIRLRLPVLAPSVPSSPLDGLLAEVQNGTLEVRNACALIEEVLART